MPDIKPDDTKFRVVTILLNPPGQVQIKTVWDKQRIDHVMRSPEGGWVEIDGLNDTNDMVYVRILASTITVYTINPFIQEKMVRVPNLQIKPGALQ